MEIVDAGRYAPAADGTASYAEHLSVPALSVGTYSIPAGSVDDQVPHAEDEIYVVVSGRGAFTADGHTADARRGASGTAATLVPLVPLAPLRRRLARISLWKMAAGGLGGRG